MSACLYVKETTHVWNDLPPNRPVGRRRAARPFFVLYMLYMPCAYFLMFTKPQKDSWQAYALALAAGITVVAMLVVGGITFAKQRDEFQRKLLTEAMVWGIGGTLSITTIWGLLEMHTSIPQLNILCNFPIFLTITAIAKVALFRRNPVSDE